MTRYEPYRTRYPLLPLKNIVIFPRNIVTLLVGRPRSIQAVEEALNRDRRVVVVAHRDPEIDDPLASDVYNVGTLAEVVKSERQQATTLQVVLEGICRVRLTAFDTSRPFFNVAAEELTEIESPLDESRALMKHVTELASTYSESRNKLTTEVLDMIQRASDPGHLADLLATQLLSDTTKRPGTARTGQSLRPARQRRRADPERPRHRRARAADQGPRPRPGREEPARVLPARTAQGDPRRARRRGRQRDGQPPPQDHRKRHARRRRGEAQPRAVPPRAHAGRLGRGDRRPHLHRYDARPALDQAERGPARSRRRRKDP